MQSSDVVEDLRSARIYLRLVGLAANLLLLTVSIVGLRLKLLYPKRYVFVTSKTVADTLACLSIAIIVWVRQYADVPDFLLGSSIVVITISVYSASVCNCALAVITFVAISKPFFYKSHITLRRCIYVVACVWCFAAIIGITTTVFGVATYKPKRVDSCPLACQQGFKITGAIIVWALYILSPATYILILVSIKRSAHENSVKEVRNLWKLGLNILAFAVFSLPSCVDQAIAIAHLK
uniref:G-protein coupled receptors family 1 profile domain-containing protein n=1 Tax=Plectus sambesii TaxID=2011161 RepID=A0A914VQP1_9BILA